MRAAEGTDEAALHFAEVRGGRACEMAGVCAEVKDACERDANGCE